MGELRELFGGLPSHLISEPSFRQQAEIRACLSDNMTRTSEQDVVYEIEEVHSGGRRARWHETIDE